MPWHTGSVKFHRELLGTYLIVLAGLGVGIAIGTLTSAEPAWLRWVFGLGIGLTGGAFVAATVSGVQLVGRGPAQDPETLDDLHETPAPHRAPHRSLDERTLNGHTPQLNGRPGNGVVRRREEREEREP